MSSDPLGPTIPASVSFESNRTRALECIKLISNSLQSGTIRMTGGHLTNLVDPVNPQDICTKSYADGKLNRVADPNRSIQYNNNGQFAGSSLLLFTDGSLSTGSTLYSSSTTIGTGSNYLSIGSGVITGVPAPTNNTNIVSKSYMDSYYTLSTTTSTNSNITYSASQMVNGFITKNSTTGTDTTATGTQIVQEMNSVLNPLIVGNTTGTLSSCRFMIRNVHTSDTLSLASGIGISIYPTISSLTLYAGYSLDSVIQATSLTTANLLVTDICYIGSAALSTSNFLMGPRSMYASSYVTRVGTQFTFDTSINTINNQNVTYSPSDIIGVVHRNFTGAKTDTFSDVSSFVSSYSTYKSPIYNIFTTGAVEFVIKNISTSGSLTLVGNSQWTMDPNSNMTIVAGHTGLFYLYIDVTNLLGYIYVIGII
jgi:hypothetical protein